MYINVLISVSSKIALLPEPICSLHTVCSSRHESAIFLIEQLLFFLSWSPRHSLDPSCSPTHAVLDTVWAQRRKTPLCPEMPSSNSLTHWWQHNDRNVDITTTSLSFSTLLISPCNKDSWLFANICISSPSKLCFPGPLPWWEIAWSPTGTFSCLIRRLSGLRRSAWTQV